MLLPLTAAILLLSFGISEQWYWMQTLSSVAFFVAMSMAWFFRDPQRPINTGVVSPADGKVVRIDSFEDPELGPVDRLSIFMSPLNVHVNRAPLVGDVMRVEHRAGGHKPAYSKDSDHNEQVTTYLKTEIGTVAVRQISGAFARRIVPYIEPGQHLDRGERLGLIRMGSRCDILVPQGKVRWTLEIGHKVKAAATRVGDLL